jgi:hypothetical protein
MMGVGGTAAAEGHESREPSVLDFVQGFQQKLFADLAPDDLRGRLVRGRWAIDCLELAYSRDAAALAQSDMFSPDDLTSTPIDWMRHNCRMQYGVALDRLTVGEQLPALEASGRAVADGEIGFAHLSVLARMRARLGSSWPRADSAADAAPALPESDLLEQAKASTPGRFWHHCRRVLHALNPEGVATEQRLAAEQRWLRLAPMENGSICISGQLDSIGGAALQTALEPLARPSGEGDDRCRERRYADAAVELAMLALDGARLPHVATQRPHLQVTTTLETLRGLSGSPAADLEFAEPISTRTVQRLACDASVSRVVFGPGSVIVDAGRARRVVSGPTRRALNARDRQCRWPGCERPASSTAAHHLVHWAMGGPTDLSNMVLLCHRHHWCVHEGGWKLARAEDDRLLALPPTYDYFHRPRAPDEFIAA